MTPTEINGLVDEMRRTGQLPRYVPAATMDEVSKSLARYFNDVGASKVQEFSDKVKELLTDALNPAQDERGATVGASKAEARGGLLDFLEGSTAENIGDTMGLDFFLRVPMEVASGAAQKLAQNWDQARVEEFPGLEFHRVYDRDVPRGSEKDPAGPENAWDDDGGRWVAACQEAGDDDALSAFEDTGRCVALKSSGVWEALGDGAGGYEDTLGNDYEPFAFNSGWGTDELSYDDCVALGLLDDGEKVEAPDVDLGSLLGSFMARRTVRALLQPSLAAQNAANRGRRGLLAYLEAAWDEDLHPRDSSGRFSSGGGSGGGQEEAKFDSIHGRTVSELIRSMHKAGFSREHIKTALESYGVSTAKDTIRWTTSNAHKYVDAPLSEAQVADLKQRSGAGELHPPPPKELPQPREQRPPEPPAQPKAPPKPKEPEVVPEPPDNRTTPPVEATREQVAEHLMSKARFHDSTVKDVEDFRRSVQDCTAPYHPNALGRITENVDTIRLAPPGREYQQFTHGQLTGSFAFYRPGEKLVVMQSASKYDNWAFTHELGHAVDRKNKTDYTEPYRYSGSPEWKEAWEKDKKFNRNPEGLGRTLDYWKKNPREGFAVSCEHAALHGYKSLKERVPHMAKLLGDWKILKTDYERQI